ncbi:hypothetical protein B296_00032631 [Ensete ventricosum]|uniref:Uncharacterized protein n=1 Tax=Ensete ventricosum TaxID=4639 RepID=A0A427ABP7_ENSVE|nr:hypothetical protein B296_00032631 [Ensete ventricosum]
MRHQDGFFSFGLELPCAACPLAAGTHGCWSKQWPSSHFSLKSFHSIFGVYLQTLEKNSDIRRHDTVITSVMPFNIKVEPLVAGGTDPKTVDPVGTVVLRTDELVLATWSAVLDAVWLATHQLWLDDDDDDDDGVTIAGVVDVVGRGLYSGVVVVGVVVAGLSTGTVVIGVTTSISGIVFEDCNLVSASRNLLNCFPGALAKKSCASRRDKQVYLSVGEKKNMRRLGRGGWELGRRTQEAVVETSRKGKVAIRADKPVRVQSTRAVLASLRSHPHSPAMRPDQASPRRHFFPPSKLRKLLLPVLLPISSSHPAAEALLLHSYVDVVFDPLNTHVGARSFRPTSSLAPYSAPQHPGLRTISLPSSPPTASRCWA